MCRPPSSGRVRGRACCLPYPASGRQWRPSVALHVCFLTGAPRRRRDPAAARRFTRPSPRDVDRLSSGVRREGGEAVIPRPVVRRPMAVALLRSLSPNRFERATAGYVDRPQAAMESRHRPGTAPGPARDRPSPFAPPPAIQLRSRR